MTHPVRTMQVTTPTDREIVMTRTFDAPRDLVFEAWTNPGHVRHWWGWRTSEMIVCEVDLRPGGSWRYVTREQSGEEVPFTGVYREVDRPARLVYTEIYDVEPFNSGDPAVTTATFTEEGGGTLLRVSTLFPSREVRDGVLATGMEAGAAESMDRLAERLQSMA
jgi:uncharacterized protein YndB with AHSA1/START domain